MGVQKMGFPIAFLGDFLLVYLGPIDYRIPSTRKIFNSYHTLFNLRQIGPLLTRKIVFQSSYIFIKTTV